MQLHEFSTIIVINFFPKCAAKMHIQVTDDDSQLTNSGLEGLANYPIWLVVLVSVAKRWKTFLNVAKKKLTKIK